MGSYRDTAKKMMNFKASNFLNKKGEPAKGLQESWTKLITEYDIPFFRKFKNVVDFLNYTEKHFNKRGRDILRRIDKMRYVHNRPQPKYEPRVYTTQTQTAKPTQTQTAKPTQVTTDWEKLNSEVDEMEREWDDMYEEYQKSKDPKLRKKMDDLDKQIGQKIDQLNRMDPNNLPF
jgi:outer membrane murein-binding lipoprotein Lpp